ACGAHPLPLAPHAVAPACALLPRPGLVLASPSPRQVAGTLSERLVQPLLQWSILTFVPLRLAERTHRPSLAAANGQFLTVRRAAYCRAAGPDRHRPRTAPPGRPQRRPP